MEGARWTYKKGKQQEQLDHVLLSKFLCRVVTAATVIRFDKNVSDHGAFVVDIEVPSDS